MTGLIQEATIQAIHDAMRAGQLTSGQLVQAYLDRIAEYDRRGPSLTAIQTANPRALEEANRMDARMRTSEVIGPLHGIPVVVKDQVETSDMPTTYGSTLFRDFVPARDATVVRRLRGAGAVILAKTTMGELAAGYAGGAFGACRNAYDPSRDPSGSSSGSGVAVAANLAILAVGEDTLGSVRGPAARGSLVGLRPTLPLVSRFGMMPATPTRDTLGPMARSVRDAAILLDVLAGYDPADPVTAACVGHLPASYTDFLAADGLKGRRLGVIREPMAEDTDPAAEDYVQVRVVIDRALADLSAQGAEVVDPVVIPSLRDLLARTRASFETEAAIDRYLAEHASAPVRTLRELVLSSAVLPSRRSRLIESLGKTTDDPGYLRQILAREELRQAVLSVMADHRLDALVYATFDHDPAPIPADVMTAASISQVGNNRALAPMVVFPALTVPAGFTGGGLPVGLELLGRPFTEGRLFSMAFAYEQATHHRRPPESAPPLPGEP
jgi:Asp-tRNA(Asn)/Glu-tRNA(Gln) amidotransferase A subunit family amidase